MSFPDWITPDDLIAQAAVKAAQDAHDRHIASKAVAEARAADAAISDEELAAEYRAWWQASYGESPNSQAVPYAVAWARHLLTRGQD